MDRYSKVLGFSAIVSLGMSSLACDLDDEPRDADEAAPLELRDLSPSYRNARVLIESLDTGYCLFFHPALGDIPWDDHCDNSDTFQHFRFKIHTYIGGVGYIYRICSEEFPDKCLRQIDEEYTPDTLVFDSPGSGDDLVRIQHDEEDAVIEFLSTGLCLTSDGIFAVADAEWCTWTGSGPQHYQLHLVYDEEW